MFVLFDHMHHSIMKKSNSIPASIRHNIKKLTVIVVLITIVSCRFYFDTTKDKFSARTTATSIENGKNLTYNMCGGCHYNAEEKKFIGRPLNDLPAIGGKLYSANLTQSASNGIPPKYSDAELFYLLKTGISRNGKFMPYMMWPMIADADANDIIVYLRSHDEAVAADDTTVGISHLNFIGKTGIRIASKPEPYTKGIARPDENNPVEYGRYLVEIVGCYHCHSEKVLGLDYLNPEQSKGFMQGGMKLKDKDGKKIYSPNLTPDRETGIGNFTQTDFTKAVKEGITPAGRQLKIPMPKFTHLTDKQVAAIYAYIKQLAPVHNKIKS
jgi:mono/diheme cytochrome c family protein